MSFPRAPRFPRQTSQPSQPEYKQIIAALNTHLKDITLNEVNANLDKIYGILNQINFDRLNIDEDLKSALKTGISEKNQIKPEFVSDAFKELILNTFYTTTTKQKRGGRTQKNKKPTNQKGGDVITLEEYNQLIPLALKHDFLTITSDVLAPLILSASCIIVFALIIGGIITTTIISGGIAIAVIGAAVTIGYGLSHFYNKSNKENIHASKKVYLLNETTRLLYLYIICSDQNGDLIVNSKYYKHFLTNYAYAVISKNLKYTEISSLPYIQSLLPYIQSNIPTMGYSTYFKITKYTIEQIKDSILTFKISGNLGL